MDLAAQFLVGEVVADYVESDLSSVALRLGSGYRLAGFAMNLDNRLS
ncbi:hypothetical protein ACIBIZ_52200 [Nonomuraea spiralis]